jgi:hypothetical protein
MRLRAILLLGAGALLSTPAVAQPALPSAPPAPPAVAAAPSRAAVDALVTAMLDEAMLLTALGDATERQFVEMVKTDKAFGAMVRDYPGLDKALGERTRTELGAIVKENIGGLRSSYADLLAAKLNATQIDATAALLATPTGKALFEYGMRLGAAQKISGGETKPDTAAILKLMKPADAPALLAFQRTGASAAIKALGPDLARLGEQWGQSITSKNEDRLMTAGLETTIDYIAHVPAAADPASGEKVKSGK